MADFDSILITIHSDTQRGQQLIGDRWLSFFYTLRNALQQDAIAELEGNDELLLFQHHQLATAINSFFTRLDQTKQEYQWDSGVGPTPIQIILHGGRAENLPQPLRDPASKVWTLLHHEIIYITKPLREQWATLIQGGELAAHQIGDEELGLSPLVFPSRTFETHEPIFPYRHLVRATAGKKCFYCGMTNHTPTNCPSKQLTMQTQGLSLVGYLPLPRLGELFQEAFTHQEQLLPFLTPGISTSQLRHDPVLQTYVAFFDLCKIYQPRFLWNIAFSAHSRWQDLGKPETITVDSHGLYLGLDCLRVGQYAQAEDLFIDESRRLKGKQFHATIARAFLSLELDREHDMGHYLESALRMATTDKDRIYVSLLLSRHYSLLDNNWKAEHALDNVLSIDRDCPEALYAQIQSAVKNGFGNRALNQLRALIIGQKELFIHALMDPELIPIERQVEELLATRLETQRQEAEEPAGKARAMVTELEDWLTADAPEMKHLLADLAGIEEQYAQQSYYDLIDIAVKARLLLQRCYRVQEMKLDALKQRNEKAMQRWMEHRAFWDSYTYPSLFGEFPATLTAIKTTLAEARESTAKKMHGTLYREIVEKLDKAETQFETLKQLTTRMTWTCALLDGLKLFGRKLLIAECGLLVLSILMLAAAMLALDNQSGTGFTALLRDSWFQKQMIQLVTLLIAPLLAVAQTLWAIMND